MLDCQKLYELMDEVGIKSFKELSLATRIPYTTLNYMRTGHDMQVSTLVELAKYFGVPIDYLINSTYGVRTYTENKTKYLDTTNLIEATILYTM